MKQPSKMQQRLAMGRVARRVGPTTYAQMGIGLTPSSAARLKEQEKADKEASAARKKVIFMSRADVSVYRFKPDDVLVSISDTNTEAPFLSHQPEEVCELHFNDHVTSQDVAMGLRWMSPEDGIKLADFVLKHTDKPNIIVHCNYGESRSKAVAMAINAFDEDRRVLRIDYRGRMVAYRKDDNNGDRGNSRVLAITLDSLMFRSEGLDS